MVYLEYLALCFLPALALRAVCWMFMTLPNRVMQWWAEQRERSARQAAVEAATPNSRREQYGKDLKRLAVDHEKIRRSDNLAQAHRLQAIQRAYDDTLREACLEFDVDAPNTEFDDAARLQVEADLLVRGVTW